MQIAIKKLQKSAVIPTYAKDGDAGLDLTATSLRITNEFLEYGTGLSIEIPEGYVGLLYPRSSISKTDLFLANGVGVIDSGYRGEIKLRFKKYTSIIKPEQRYSPNDRVGQLIIIPYPKITFYERELSATERGEGGFGSTNVDYPSIH